MATEIEIPVYQEVTENEKSEVVEQSGEYFPNDSSIDLDLGG